MSRPTLRSMNESTACDVVFMRVLETTDRERALWTDADREWATRAAAELVTESGRDEDFLVRRAALVRERASERQPGLRRMLSACAWPGWITPLVLIIALVAGFGVDRIGDDGRVNLLAPPILALCAWNLAVYALLLVRAWVAALARRRHPLGFLQRGLVRLAEWSPWTPRAGGKRPQAATVAAFMASWTASITPLYAARAARILHLAAIAFACGVLIGLYLRGLALEYRASWQSTFLDPVQVHDLLRVVLAPGSWLTGIAVPDVTHIAALRSAATSGGENAARWVHLYAATVALVVVVPRLLLAAAAWLIERRRARRLDVVSDEPYYHRLLRAFRQGPLRVLVVPYSTAVSASALETLKALVKRAFGACDLEVADGVAYGGEDSLGGKVLHSNAHLVIALFNLTGTPERVAHGVLLSRLGTACRPAGDLIALIDESAFRARWPHDDQRRAERRGAWREFAIEHDAPPVFVELERAELARDAEALQRALEKEVA